MSGPYSNSVISRHFCWSAAAFTDVGKVRKVNEDDFMANADQAHWAVSDGMGGHARGDLASQSISQALGPLQQTAVFDQFVDAIEDSLIGVNQNLRDIAGNDGTVIGSTVAGLAMHQQHALYYWVGDSRIYRLREQKLTQLSIDHTFTQELVEQGKITPEQVSNHPDKNVITRAIGADDQVFVDFEMTPVMHQDVFFLCSDGVEKELSDQQLEACLNQYQLNQTSNHIVAAGQQILDTVLSRGARDNVTLIIIRAQQL